MQSKNLDIIGSRTNRIPQRVSKYQREVDSKVFKPKSSYGKRAYEEAQAWNQKYDTKGKYEAIVHTCACHYVPCPTCCKCKEWLDARVRADVRTGGRT